VKNIALIDPYWSGHHSTYLKLFSKALLSIGNNVTVFCQKPQVLKDWISKNSEQYKDSIDYFELNEPEASSLPIRTFNPTLYAFRLWYSADQAIKKAYSSTGRKPDLVFFAYLDDYLSYFQSHYLIDQIFPYNWSGLYFNPYQLRHNLRALPIYRGPLDYDENLRSKHCKSIAVLDEEVSTKLQDKLQGKPVVLFPDVTDESSPDRSYQLRERIVKEAKGRKIITVLGSLAKRKGMLSLLEVASKSIQDDWFFVFAGKLATHTFTRSELDVISHAATKKLQNCFFYFDFIPEEPQLNSLVEISDILWASYEDSPNSSNALTKAALFRKPVIVSKGCLVERRVRNFNMGEVVEYGAIEKYIESIGKLCNPSDDNVFTRRKFDEYRSLHSFEKLVIALNKIMQFY
jgi:Glycosyl transferases group 1